MNHEQLQTNLGAASDHRAPRAARTLWASFILALFALLVAACGGGGGGDAGNGGGSAVTPPVITVQPASVSAVVGARAVFSVVVDGNGIAYQWQRSTNNGLSWLDVAGASSASYTVAAVAASMNADRYHVIVQNVAGIVVSASATLTVTAPGGGGGGGIVPADCVPADVLPVGMVVGASYALDTGGIAGTPWQVAMTVVGPSTFQGRSVFETRIDTTGTFLPGVTRAFSSWDAATRELTPWGAIVRLEVGTTIADITSVARQPARYPVYALGVGQSATVTAVSDNTQVLTVNGVAGAPQASTETATTTYTFLGTETLTVPAGTFLTCKVRQQVVGSMQPTTNWLMAGYGATVKSISGTNTQLLTAITVNGTPLTRFP